MPETSHLSVMKEEILELFRGRKLRTYVDATLGAAGHAAAMLEEHPEIERFIGIDQDPDALQIARKRLEPWKEKITLVQSNFSALTEILMGEKIDGILFDLGVSSMQLDRAEKGFSFMKDGPLDMRMDPTRELTAATIVNEWSEQELTRIFRQYGEEKQPRKAARAIVQGRPFKTTKELSDLLYPVLFNPKKKIHPLTLIFQALRICVNGELEVIEKVIPEAIDALTPGGVMGVISFHSLEDRRIKQMLQFAASDKLDTSGRAGVFIDKKPLVRILTRKPLVPTPEEAESNPRARSAKFRGAEKLE